tara:strand:- start:1694 stop:1861 length:168 start_codon:yes stop_codon:yes gene_type:complete
MEKDTTQILLANISALSLSLSEVHLLLQVLTMATALLFTLYKFLILYKKENKPKE